MALDHGDLFFINRSGATYKIEAVELGNYLTGNDLPDGTNIVNDGILAIANTGNPNLVANIALHSANDPNDSVLDFDKHFVVQSRGTDATVSINFMEFKDSFLCNNGVGSGFDINNCDCLQLDFDEIGQRIPCPDGGIVSNMGCLQVNLCSDSLITLNSVADGPPCLDVNICENHGLEQVDGGGCLKVDMEYIVNNVVCKNIESGLTTDGTCLAVEFDKVMANMNLGLIESDGTVKVMTNGGDLRQGNVKLGVDWSLNPDTNGCEGDILYITQGGIPRGLYDPCMGRSQTIDIPSSAGGGGGGGNNGGGGTGGCVNGGILLDDANDCLYLDKSDSGCIEAAFMNVAGINIRDSNGISFNTAGSTIAGVNLNVNNRSFRLEYDSKQAAGEEGVCKPWGQGINVLRCSLGGAAGTSGRLFRSEAFDTMNSKDDDDNEGPAYIKSIKGEGRHELLIDIGKRATYPEYITEQDKVDYQARRDNPENYLNENPYYNFNDAAPPNITEATDTASLSIINNLDVDIDNIIDTLGKSKSSGGLLRWGRVQNSETQKLNLFFDPNELGTAHPWLAKGYYSSGSYEGAYFPDDNHLWVHGDIKPEDQRNIKYYQVDHDAVAALNFVAHRRMKQRITDLETQLVALETRLAALEAS